MDILLSQYDPINAIGKALKRSPFTTASEIFRHTKGRKYCDQEAYQLAQER
ncbi:MAG: hypothetical protein HAW67_08040 [Endozoicomonadaceae bacterium]|nr:hypothetical protein [Endozoicomonadaceae bacterium]MBE8233673.1 hypothetical protein [Endozoicomonadaceae bacterium]